MFKLEIKCYIFDIHINCCFLAGRWWEDGICFYTHDLVEWYALGNSLESKAKLDQSPWTGGQNFLHGKIKKDLYRNNIEDSWNCKEH